MVFGVFVAPTALAQGKAEPAPEEHTGVKIGANAPKFTLKDQKGQERSLDEKLFLEGRRVRHSTEELVKATKAVK
jgi:hypothetical protein